MAVKTVSKGQTDTTEDSSVDETLELVLKAFNTSWEYTSSSWHARWEDNYKLYNNQRVKRGYFGISDTFVPMTFGTIETLTSGLFGTKPKFDYLPPSTKPDQKTDILNGLLDFYWDKDQWSLKIINTGRGMLREGTSVDYFCWERDHPRLINIPIRDFFIDPNAFELDENSTGYCGRRYLTTWDALNEYEIIDLDAMDAAKPDPDTGEVEPVFKKKYKDLDKLKSGDSDDTVEGTTQHQDQTTDKEQKDMLYGSTLEKPQKDQVEVIEYWTTDRVISIANRQVVIEDTDNYYKAQAQATGDEFAQGILPFADCRDYVDGSLFYAKSEVDFISDQQEDLNDFSNQEKDAVSINLNPQKTLDPKYGHLIEKIGNFPGAVYPVETGALQPIPIGTIPPEAFNERLNIKNEIRETTATNQVIQGSPNTNPGKQTATEVNAQVAGAGQRINLKSTQLENGYFHRMAKIVFRMVQLYVNEPMMVRILGKTGVEWQTFDPSEFQGEYEPRVQLDITVQNQKQQDATNAANLLKAFLGDPNVNQQELTKIVLQRGFQLDPDEVQSLMAPPPQGMPAGAPVPGAVPGMPPTGAPVPTGPTPTDIVPHPQTGEPVMAGQLA